MAAVRDLVRIVVRIDSATGNPIDIEALTEVLATENQLTVQTKKIYSAQYVDLGAGAQGRIDGFVGDVRAFINNQEPIIE